MTFPSRRNNPKRKKTERSSKYTRTPKCRALFEMDPPASTLAAEMDFDSKSLIEAFYDDLEHMRDLLEDLPGVSVEEIENIIWNSITEVKKLRSKYEFLDEE